ncbi:MAG: primosomal protein N' [Patescibacteria group bacterium]|nr:primosomal protein N' [Patescibacteria group bacterium]
MIAEIIPAVRLPRNLNSFSYLVPAEMAGVLKVGMIVEVDFRGRKVDGLIIKIRKQKSENRNQKTEIREKNNFKLKPIKKIVFPTPLVTLAQIDLIRKIAKYYGVSEGVVCRSFLPALSKRLLRMYESYEYTNRTTKTKKVKIVNSHLFWWQNLDERNTEYKKNINKTKGQILILTPQIDFIEQLIKDLKLDEKKVIRIHNGIKPKEFFENWLKILSGEPKIIIGTKMALTLSFSNLKTIIIDEEQDWNHKQSDINPRYDARMVAEWLASAHGAELVLASAAPRVETYYELLKSENRKQKSGDSTRSLGSPEYSGSLGINLVNLQDEKTKGNYSLLSDSLKEKIEEILKTNKKIFLLHNRKGTSGFVSCADCGHVFLCPECQISLNYFQTQGRLKCGHCAHQEEVPPLCPKCSGPKITFKAKGVEDLALELKKIFPEINILAAFKNEGKKTDFSKAQIIAGTEFALSKINWEEIGLAAIVNFDQLVNRPDLGAQKGAYDLLKYIQGRLQGELIIQAHNLDNIILKSIKENRPEIFYENELENRKDLNYPPFCRLIKIIFQDKSKARAYYLSDQLAREIKKLHTCHSERERGIPYISHTRKTKGSFTSPPAGGFVQDDNTTDWQVNGPIPAVPEKIRGNFFYHIIVKLPLAADLNKLFKIIPPDFVVDTDPEKLT